MRALLAIVFSFLIAGTQAATLVSNTAGANASVGGAKCSCAQCETTCCPRPAGQNSVPLPALPGSLRQNSDWQGLTECVVETAWLVPERAKAPVFLFSFSP